MSLLDSPHVQPYSQSGWMGTERTDRDSRREGVQQIREPSLSDDAADICRFLRGKARMMRALNLVNGVWGGALLKMAVM